MILLTRPSGNLYSTILEVSYIVKWTNSTTVNLENLARVLFSQNFAYAKFRENKTLAKCQNQTVVN